MKESTDTLALSQEPWLKPYATHIQERHQRYLLALQGLADSYGDVVEFASAHQLYGIHWDPIRRGWYYREWAPAAKALYLTGDFNWWDRRSHPLKRNHRGDWEIFLPYETYKDTFVHASTLKVVVIGANDTELDRIPAYIRRVIQDPESHNFSGQLWFPNHPYTWKTKTFQPRHKTEGLFIYECHVGMALEEEKVGSYAEFAQLILPRIHAAGYTAIQLMAIMEHPYYGSFGYHVSNFFAASSRFGTPEELKALIDDAHALGIAVILDVVHSHAVKNVYEGLNEFDGTPDQYFHPGDRGYHEGWDSKLFQYGKWEVLQFLLSNLRFWMEEYRFDGFRFDGVTSMLYEHHGHTDFSDAERYFDVGVDQDAVLYFQLANHLIHRISPDAISIAEEVTGMPGLARSLEDGGLGFDFRLAMGIPDFWIKTLKYSPDEHWDMFGLWHALTNRPAGEGTVAYAESHDQALVGDKSIAFWLMDKEMYHQMHIGSESLVIDRGIALHKIIRMLTLSLGGEAYMNFIGNEFGHPEWVDFPREGNKWSYQYARRQWSLVDNEHLRFKYLFAWDMAMLQLAKVAGFLTSGQSLVQHHLDADQKGLVYEKGGYLVLVNLHPSKVWELPCALLPEGPCS
ncbi:1,4-alpha-glucan-branching protein [Nitritalea halalkaliphila LW7]|uniref:1,4-alpha-glucan-branching protein n=1 Tax=Nitritalea halalkaliphila LW7 TaxID=1189621 RepID=I5C3S7_9BACT|nr:alpha-amylase family glycosyl hydrolase [Nitritalea halalkaliphila]EIM76479.1 1,4-alpha-glucan-branching protein [Nitritalea halalkaliphila LW7]